MSNCTSGYSSKFLVAPISWCCKKQSVVALLSYETEYVIDSYASCKAIWLDQILKEMIVDIEKLIVDNKPSLNLAPNPVIWHKQAHTN